MGKWSDFHLLFASNEAKINRVFQLASPRYPKSERLLATENQTALACPGWPLIIAFKNALFHIHFYNRNGPPGEKYGLAI